MSNPSENSILKTLQQDGVVVLENFLKPSALESLKKTMCTHLSIARWNSPYGYTNDDNFRLMLEDVLTMDENFQKSALDQRTATVMREFLGPDYCLVEAKAWRSLPCLTDFHGWHNDAWYDHQLKTVPRQLKLAIYLSDVSSGAFTYVCGTHGQTRHGIWSDAEVKAMSNKTVSVTGKAGTAFLFDTSGIHRQSFPILENRDAVFFCYNDPKIALQSEDISYYRYHPLQLNAAFLGNLTPEEQRVLGFGNKSLLVPHYVRPPRHPKLADFLTHANKKWIAFDIVLGRIKARWKKITS